VSIHAEDNTVVCHLEALKDRFGADIPHPDASIFTAGSNEGKGGPWKSIRAKGTSHAVLFVAMSLIRFDTSTVDVVPESNAIIQCPCKHVFAIGGETHSDDRGIVLVDQCA
jgi:hypothetical protein